jgi:hypothetical protein
VSGERAPDDGFLSTAGDPADKPAPASSDVDSAGFGVCAPLGVGALLATLLAGLLPALLPALLPFRDPAFDL